MQRLHLLLLMLLLAGPATAQDSPAQWAVKLGSRTYAEREKAAKALEQLGAAAMPVLRNAAATADLETKRRAVQIMERIEDRLISDELLAATPTRLQFKDVPIDDALRLVEKQTGVQGAPAPGPARPIRCDTGILPFWQAWRKFCADAGLFEHDYPKAPARLRRVSPDDVRVLAAGSLGLDRDLRPRFVPYVSFAASKGSGTVEDNSRSVRLRVRWHELSRSIDKETPHAVFAIEVRPEPRLDLFKWPRVQLTKYVDVKGVARAVPPVKLIPDTSRPDDALLLAAFAGEIQFGGALQLKAIPWQGPPATLKELHGIVRMEVQVRPRLMEIADVARAVGKEVKSFQGLTMKVLDCDMDEEGEIQMRVRMSNLASLAPLTPDQSIVRVRPGVIAVRGEMDVALERLELYNSAGRKCQLLRARYESAGKGKGYDAELTFATAADKTKKLTLVMTKAPRTVPLEMPFVVRDVAWTAKD